MLFNGLHILYEEYNIKYSINAHLIQFSFTYVLLSKEGWLQMYLKHLVINTKFNTLVRCGIFKF